MMEAERLGTRAMAWADADRDAIFGHILALEMALRLALELLKNSAYASHMRDNLIQWQALLEAVPPNSPGAGGAA
jgi:hypothetical protein